MKRWTRFGKTSTLFLGITMVLWAIALLFRFRVINIFDAVLMKFPGPAVIFGLMGGGPLIVFLLSVRRLRRGQSPMASRGFAVWSGLLLAAFIVMLGIPMLTNALKAKTPLNPSTPRIVDGQMGLPVFPGAEGFGTDTPAGRGGTVIEVTSLQDRGAGSLRAALNASGPRIIVFRVGGTIELVEPLFINHPFVTVAGQTAPGDGICLKNIGIAITTHDVLIQHLRIRPGNQGKIEPDNNDAVSIMGHHGEISGAHHVVLDHISTSWGEDETISTWYGAHDITISWSIISEALNRSRHRKKTHSAGLLIGDSSYHVSVHHNLMAHNDFRNPLIAKGGTHDIVNNVVYNWGILPAEIVDEHSNSFLNFVGNVFRAGPSTQPGNYEILISPGQGVPKLYVEGNIGPHRPDASADEWTCVGYGYGDQGTAPEIYRISQRYASPPVTVYTAKTAVELVLAQAGATMPSRDTVDARVVSEVRDGTGKIIDSPQDVDGYPVLASGVPPADSDHDGMPDDWESAQGLNPTDPLDGNGDRDGDGYTNVEEYLHSLLR